MVDGEEARKSKQSTLTESKVVQSFSMPPVADNIFW
jgi:hypothetical protein